jgi:hypothetical protein
MMTVRHKIKSLEENLPQYHCVYYKVHMNLLGLSYERAK